MKKALKITGIVLGILVLLVIMLAVALPFIINPNSFKDEIAKLVKERTGRDLVIQGDIKLSIFPWLGMQIGPAELSNAKGFTGTPFASINETDVHVRFWPLLHREVDVGEVKLDGLNLDLEKDADGHDNWQDISERLAHAPAQGEASAGRNIDLSVAGVSVTASQVRWTDAAKHQQYTISDFTLKLGAFASAKPLSVDSAFDFTGTNPAVQGHVDFSGTATADLEHRLYTADAAKLEFQAQGDAVPGDQLKTTLRWQHLAYNQQQATLAVNGLDASAYGMNFQMDAQGKDVGKDASFNGSVRLARFSPRDALKALGHADLTQARDPNAFGVAYGSFGFTASTSAVAFNSVDFTLDDSHMTGSAALKDFKTRAMSFDLNLDKLDADRYLPPQQLGTPDKPREALDLDNVGVPLRTLRVLDLQGHLHVGSLALLGAKASDFDVKLTTQDGQLTVKPFSANLYGGVLSGELTVDGRESNGDQPLVTESLEVQGVQMGGLGQDLFNSARFSGAMDLSATLHAQGRIFRELRRSVNGRVSYKVKDGALEGVSVWDAIAQAYARAQGKTPPAATSTRTGFSELHGSANVAHGVMVDRGFSAALPSLAVSGSGKLDLADLTVDYSLRGRVTGRPVVGDAALRGASLSLHVTGTLGSLRVQPDVSGVATPKTAAADTGHGGV